MVPLTYATCRAMWLHPLAAILCSWLVLVDTLWIGLSRVHLNDMVQMVFIALTHWFAIRACEPPSLLSAVGRGTRAAKTCNDDADGSCDDGCDTRPDFGRDDSIGCAKRDAVALAATGLCVGCALQCKYAMALTTLAWLGLQNLVTL